MNKPIEELIQRLKEPDYKYYGCKLCKSEAELVISALEKQISIKPIPPKTKMRKQYICPTCKGVAGDTHNEYEFCRNCGQKLDWSVEE